MRPVAKGPALDKQSASIRLTPGTHPSDVRADLESHKTSRNCRFPILFSCYRSGGGEGSLDRLLPTVNTGLSPRKRTTSQCKSEPPLLRTSKRTIYTAGRPPWYNEHGTQSKEAFVIGETHHLETLRRFRLCVLQRNQRRPSL